MSRVRNLLSVMWALLRRPELWVTAGALAVRLVPNDWWRGITPPVEYLHYRGPSVYGAEMSEIPAVDFIRYLEWCKAFPGPIR